MALVRLAVKELPTGVFVPGQCELCGEDAESGLLAWLRLEYDDRPSRQVRFCGRCHYRLVDLFFRSVLLDGQRRPIDAALTLQISLDLPE